jgi:GntR family transcriptional regulator / MocR family aminotransferase
MGTRRCDAWPGVTGSNPPAVPGVSLGNAGGRSWVPYPPVALDRAANLPLYRQIEVALRRSILDGRIGPGARLPGIRAYARHLGVGAVTVMTAYEQLTAEGYLEAHPGRGTLVAPGLPDLRAGMRPRSVPRGPGELGSGDASACVLPTPSAGPRRPFFEGTHSNPRYDFRTGSTSLDLFPSAVWERLLPRAWRDLESDPEPATTYRWPEGDPRLRAELAAYLGMSRAVRAMPEQIVVTAGAQGAFATAGKLWLSDGRTLAMEDPSSPHLRRTFDGLGIETIPVPVDDRGLLVDRLPEGASGVLVTPSWQYPNGGTMPVARRMHLLAWAARNRALVIEDDCDSELRYEGHPQPSLQGLDEAGRVLYVGTFSKVLYPGLRIGCAVVPAGEVELFVARHEASYRGPGALEQRALALFLAEGHFERHLARLRAHNAERQAALLAALAAELGTVVSARPAAAGAHIVVRIEDVSLSATQLAMRARALGVAVEPLSFSRRLDAGDRELVVHYARLTPADILEGVRVLARAAERRSGSGLGAAGSGAASP